MKTIKQDSQEFEILAVQDNLAQLELLKRLLAGSRYAFRTATNGKEALTLIEERKPDLIISDIVMREMDGFTLCSHVKSRDEWRDIPVILLTSLSTPQDVIKGLQCGADNFVRKPYDHKYLLSRIEYMLNHREMSKEDRIQIGAEILFSGQRHFITSDRQQILDLLISTYEQAVQVNDELKLRNEQLAASSLTLKGLCLIAENLNESKNEAEVLQRALERMRELPGVRAGWIFLLENKDSFRLGASTGIPHGLLQSNVGRDHCQCMRLLVSGDLRLADNIVECERLKKSPAELIGSRFHASIPLWSSDRVLGLMNIAGSDEELFSDENLKMFSGVGNQIGIAIERARLQASLEEKVRERTASLMAEIQERKHSQDEQKRLIAEQKQSQDALRRSEEKYRNILDSIEEGYFEVDLAGNLTFFNDTLCRMIGCSRSETVGVNYRQFMDEGNARSVYQTFNSVYQTGVPARGSDWFISTKDGIRRYVEASVWLVRDSEQNPAGFRGVVRDVTARKEAEEAKARFESQMIQAQKMESIGRLAGGVAHDFNNILMAISGYADLLLTRMPPVDFLRKGITEIQRTVEKGASLTRQLLAFSRKQVLEPAVLDLNQLITGMESMLRMLIGEDVVLKVQYSLNLGRIKADQAQIEQVIMNLAVNARDAMPSGGRITIETENVVLDETYASEHISVQPGRYVMLSVSDTGFGMDQATLSRIFDPFFTTKEEGKGTGLGLSTVYGIVKQSGGTLWVYSHEGQGTTFKIYLPVVEEELELAAQSVSAEDLESWGETILLVDDNEAVRNALGDLLKVKGYVVLQADRGKSALEIAEKHEGLIHVLISDMVMPEMDGLHLSQQLSAIRPGIKTIFISGYTEHAFQGKALFGKNTAFVSKPVTMQALLLKIRQLLRS